MTAHVIAVNRFGLGARPHELALAEPDPRDWLKKQVAGDRSPPESIASLAPSTRIFEEFTAAQNERREDRREMDAAGNTAPALNVVQNVRRVLVPHYSQQVAARYTVAGTTTEPFRERLIHFWTNHFAVSADKLVVLGLAGTLENEAIRPYVARRFVDMLKAVERHPAMIIYLDNQLSIGPNSEFARLQQRRARRNPERDRKVDINENLAREILELHTLGVGGGYTQADVTTFAQVLSGWSVGGGRGPLAGQGPPGKFIFREQLHEPGAKTILGKRYAEAGEAQTDAVLEDLAKHPSTAKFIATKLVRHFVSDEPPAAAVDRVAKVFRESDGDLPTVHRAVVDLAEAWRQPFAKFKTPHDFVISTYRAFAAVPRNANQIAGPFEQLGQRPYTPGSPAGWPDTASHWDGPDALMKRIEWSTTATQRIGADTKPLQIAAAALGELLGDHTKTAISRAASAAQGLTLLLMSPEFLRR